MCVQRSSAPSLLDKLAGGVGICSPPAASTLAVSDVEVGGSAVDVVHAEGRGSGHVVRVEDVRLLAGLVGQPLLGEPLVGHQLRVVAVFPSPRLRQRMLQHMTNVTINEQSPKVVRLNVSELV